MPCQKNENDCNLQWELKLRWLQEILHHNNNTRKKQFDLSAVCCFWLFLGTYFSASAFFCEPRLFSPSSSSRWFHFRPFDASSQTPVCVSCGWCVCRLGAWWYFCFCLFLFFVSSIIAMDYWCCCCLLTCSHLFLLLLLVVGWRLFIPNGSIVHYCISFLNLISIAFARVDQALQNIPSKSPITNCSSFFWLKYTKWRE